MKKIEYIRRIIYKLRVYLQYFYLNIFRKKKKNIIDQFHELYYNAHVLGGTWKNSKYLGVLIQKCPLDLFVYQEIITAIKPDIIIETGTAHGGGALYLATICDLLNNGRVLTVDPYFFEGRPEHPRISYLAGSSTSPAIVAQIEKEIGNSLKTLVILDSDHSKKHVLEELKIYSRFVTVGSYMIVEDSNINGHPVYPEFGPGPMEAIQEFLSERKNFRTDSQKEKFYLTFNPNGYLLRVH